MVLPEATTLALSGGRSLLLGKKMALVPRANILRFDRVAAVIFFSCSSGRPQNGLAKTFDYLHNLSLGSLGPDVNWITLG
jgi:hypothetical protein